MKIASKVLLVIEAVTIAALSISGIAFALGDVTSFASGSPGKGSVSLIEFLAAIVIFSALISGWRIFAWVVTNGPMRGIPISPVWWVFAALGASLTILSLSRLLGPPLESVLVLAGVQDVGAFFLIPFTHLIIEVIWQRLMPKRLQATNGAEG